MKIRMTLNKANRIAKKIKSMLQGRRMSFHEAVGSKAKIRFQPSRDMIANVQTANSAAENSVKEAQKGADLYKGLIDAQTEIKKALFRKNIEEGVSDAIEELAKTKDMLEFAKDAKKFFLDSSIINPETDINSDLLGGIIDAKKDDYGSSDISFTINNYKSVEEIEEDIREYAKQINKLTDFIFEKNNTVSIDVEINELVCDELGLAQ